MKLICSSIYIYNMKGISTLKVEMNVKVNGYHNNIN